MLQRNFRGRNYKRHSEHSYSYIPIRQRKIACCQEISKSSSQHKSCRFFLSPTLVYHMTIIVEHIVLLFQSEFHTRRTWSVILRGANNCHWSLRIEVVSTAGKLYRQTLPSKYFTLTVPYHVWLGMPPCSTYHFFLDVPIR